MASYIKDLVSVVMPTYKRSEMLDRAIQSVLAQTYPNIELLLVNDNEPDDEFTTDLITRVSKYKEDARFHLLMQKEHKNGAVARNVGIKAARGEYVAFLDDDDWWEPDKIAEQVKVLSSLPKEWGCVSCRIKMYQGDRLFAVLPAYKDGWVCKDIFTLVSDFETGTLVFHHDLLDQAGYFDEKLLRHQDLQLLVNFTSKYKLKMVDNVYHCRDISDANNRPNVEKIIKTKVDFFKSVDPIFQKFTPKEQQQIKLINQVEIGYVQAQNAQYIAAVKSCLPIFTSLGAFRYVIKKITYKFQSKMNAKGMK